VPIKNILNKNENFDLSIILNHIPIRLTVHEKMYKLGGVINFIPSISKSIKAVGHYISFCWRENINKWEKYDDLSTSARVMRPNSVAKKCQLLVYIT